MKDLTTSPFPKALHPPGMSTIGPQSFSSSAPSWETPEPPTVTAPTNSSVLLPFFSGRKRTVFNREKRQKKGEGWGGSCGHPQWL